jgi:hypothetical protein
VRAHRGACRVAGHDELPTLYAIDFGTSDSLFLLGHGLAPDRDAVASEPVDPCSLI